MGQSLHFEDMVRETLEMQKIFKCKNTVCETQIWKLRHQLDLAKFKVERLRKDLRWAASPTFLSVKLLSTLLNAVC